MFNKLRSIYGAGFRAGMTGAKASVNPCKRYSLSDFIWHSGWETGMKRQLAIWLASRAR